MLRKTLLMIAGVAAVGVGGVAVAHGPAPAAVIGNELSFDSGSLVSARLQGRWQLREARTSLRFNEALLSGLGLKIEARDLTAATTHVRDLGFRAAQDTVIQFARPGGALEGIEVLALDHEGGFVMTNGGSRFDLRGFRLQAAPERGELDLVANGVRWFVLRNAHIYREAASGSLYIRQMDLEVSPELAARLGQPEYAGLHAGLVDLSGRVTALSDGSDNVRAGDGSVFGDECIASFGDDIDVELMAIPDVQQLARETNVRVAFAPSAQLRNVGQDDIRWYWAIAPLGFNGPNLGSHPYLVMNTYRILDGVVEQIGASDLKHAWNTVNSNCNCPGGQVMFVGCEDTYGIGNNGNQYYFGPRTELTAASGNWQSLGSHFDASPADDFRDHGDEPAAHDSFQHRLTVAEDDLAIAGAEYVVEAWYVVAGDINIYNSMGWRRIEPTLVGNVWAFPFGDSSTSIGPALDAWVAPAAAGPDSLHSTVDLSDGHLRVAVTVVEDEPGIYSYEYAVMNLDLDRQVSAFAVPRLPQSTIISAGSGPVAGNPDPADDWQSDVAAGEVRWVAPPGQSLAWGRLYNFRIRTDTAPAATAGLLETAIAGVPAVPGALVLAPVGGSTTDSDADGIVDTADNCILVANASQRDSDGDRFGNDCDADLNNDGSVNFLDLGLMKEQFLQSGDLDADLNGDGEVNFVDLGQMKSAFFGTPGPSGTASAQ